MPLTAVEAAMFRDGGTHAVTTWAIGPTMITLSVASDPWPPEFRTTSPWRCTQLH